MRNRIQISVSGLLTAACILILTSPAAAQLHSVMLSVPDMPEEALNWCGPATGQMIMEGYPSGSCTVLQEDVWLAIQAYKSETMWDTDPVGLKEAMKHLCPPAGTWSVHARTDASELMHSVAYWMTVNNYPAAGLLNTAPHNSYTAHDEHWIAIRGIITDVNPTTNPTVNLEFIWLNDPAVPLGDPSVERFISGSTWYSELQPVTKAGSAYHGKYVAVIEPPQFKGRAIAPVEVLTGRLISPQEALKFAAKWIDKYKLYDMAPYRMLKGGIAQSPYLVNKAYGGYYLIPYARKGEKAEAETAVIVNAYTGGFQEVGAFRPVKYLSEEEAVKGALAYVGRGLTPRPEPGKVSAELVSPKGERVTSRYFPIWKVSVDNSVVGVGRDGHIYDKIPRQEPSIPLPGRDVRGMTWDGKRLWVVDGESGKLYGLDPRSGAVLQTLGVELKAARGVAFDGKSLWVADEGAMKLYAVDPGSGHILKTIDMEVPKDKGFQSVEGLAWDGKYLWTAYFAGFSSTLNQIDAESGRIVKSVFADCHPKGVAAAGGHIWSICYNGERLPAKIDRRRGIGKEHEMLRSRRFVGDIEGRAPAGLTYDGQLFWYADRETQRAYQWYPGDVKEEKSSDIGGERR